MKLTTMVAIAGLMTLAHSADATAGNRANRARRGNDVSVEAVVGSPLVVTPRAVKKMRARRTRPLRARPASPLTMHKAPAHLPDRELTRVPPSPTGSKGTVLGLVNPGDDAGLRRRERERRSAQHGRDR